MLNILWLMKSYHFLGSASYYIINQYYILGFIVFFNYISVPVTHSALTRLIVPQIGKFLTNAQDFGVISQTL